MLENKLYGGDISMVYDPSRHLYSANGVIVPSVTSVLSVLNKPALVYWAVNETLAHIKESIAPGKVYTEEQLAMIMEDAKGARFRTSGLALKVGADAHDWIERHIKARILDMSSPTLPEYPPTKMSVESFLAWEREASPRYLSSERRVYSRYHMYSGTVDIQMILDGKFVVADLKTSKGIYDEYYLQCAAYAQAIREEDDKDASALVVIRIPKDGGDVEIGTATNVASLFSVFHSCLTIWRWANKWDKHSPRWRTDTGEPNGQSLL